MQSIIERAKAMRYPESVEYSRSAFGSLSAAEGGAGSRAVESECYSGSCQQFNGHHLSITISCIYNHMPLIILYSQNTKPREYFHP